MANVPNVNFFIGYAAPTTRKDINDKNTAKYRDERQFYSSSQNRDYIEYVNNGSKEKLDYIAYSGNNEKSHGIFNESGLMDRQQIKELRNKLKSTKSVIWHGVISFTEEFGNNFCNTTEKAIEMMKGEFPKFLKKAGLNPDNILWYAGLHENTDNKHIHFSFFEKSPQRYKRNKKCPAFSDGQIPLKAIRSAKISIELKLLNIYEEMYIGRKTLTQELKKQLELGAFMKEIKSLMFVLPTTGRMSYDSENLKEYKPQINSIINAIIKSDKAMMNKFKTFEELLSKRDSEMIREYSQIKVDCSDKLLRDKCLDDLYRRLGNIVIRSVKEIRYAQGRADYETKNRLILKHIEKRKKRILLKKCIQLNELVNREMISAFQDYLERLEEANYKRLKEEGYLD